MASKELKIAITGANGFIGKNLTSELKNQGFINQSHITRDTTLEELKSILKEAEFVFHLAGVNRPILESEFEKGNKDFTQQIIETLVELNNTVPLVVSSSTQASNDNPYGRSKKAAEEAVEKYANDNNVDCGIYRLPNVFGKWSKPNYNSAIATFCHNIAHDLPIQVNDPNVELTLVYIDDVINEFIKCLDGMDTLYREVPVVHKKKLGEIVDLIYSFKASRENKSVPKLDDLCEKKLYSTYLSFLPEDQFSYELKMNVDQRGSFTEFIKTVDRGQVSINISKPGITKGNHWHHTKNEKFLVVSGSGIIRFRKPGEEKVIEYFVSGDKLEVVDIPVGYTHNIENLGETDMVTVMWVNEPFNPENPDTYFLEV
ncbi:capsular biosynthesis protein [Chryseomicrobium excrementi]|uniref:Capsular biosynthesis protein n=1 Tax=Chryseomicrobium excrementi TaxID=2041346 RepID=A0A2M9F0D5_9BACL|nr:NAD-dependent epimerase/dehydratase family protein [Chryseomicrobium excrementi]PJK16916.1 capsular biosynthesis protein [Chryseomicrobium excrementi]